MKKLKLTTDHKALRQNAFPEMGEQMDAIYKGFKALLEQGITLPPETIEWIDSIESIKDKFKKPSRS